MVYYKKFLCLALLSSFQVPAQTAIKDIIQPVNLIAGRVDSMQIRDLFYSKGYNVKVLKNSRVKTEYDKKNGNIYFRPDMGFSGITLIDFELGNKIYSIPVRSGILQKFKFRFKPARKYDKITLFGSFNGWDRGNLPMKDTKGNGIYETEIPLEPGSYEYKFFGDGEEIFDPVNPDKKPNGFGDYNSLFNVPEPNLGKLFLHIGGKSVSAGGSRYSFIYENEKDGNKIGIDNVVALLNNSRIAPRKIKITDGIIELSLPASELAGRNVIRVAVTKNGRATNIQSVYIADGIPEKEITDFDWHDATIYSLMIDRFSDGDKSINKPIVHDSLFAKANYMGGDFQGIINKLTAGYFDSLNVNTIWISPVNDNPDKAYKESIPPHRWYSGYHGYWPVSSTEVEDQFGTMDKLKELISTAHKHGIRILLDFVANHVHQDHPFFKEHPGWFGNIKLPDGRLNLRLWDEQRLTTWFEPYLPKFNYVGSREVIDTMTANAVWWLKTTGADGFRQDAVKHITNEFWRALTRKIKEKVEIPLKKNVFQIGETFGSYELISSYVNNGQLSAQFNFNLYDTALPTFLEPKMSFKALDAEMKKSFLVYGFNNLMGNIMDSHDKNRFMAFADSDLDLARWSAIEEGWNNPPVVRNPANYAKAKLYYAYMNSIPGLPVIYYGSEFGMTGASDPDNRRMMRFGNELSPAENKMLQDVRMITKIRKENSALRHGDFLTLRADQNIYAFIRSDMNQRILVVLNKNPGEEKMELTLPALYKIQGAGDLLTGDRLNINSGKLNLSINGQSYKFFLLN
jgi:cyclomaltodextrinase / maltogenic alpha-amylase / neopullulanase